MTTCVRRPHSVWSTCPCPDCVRDRNRRSKANRCGLLTRVPAEAAWEQLAAWRTAGFQALWIEAALGLGNRGIQSAIEEFDRTGHRRAFGPAYSRSIVEGDIWAATAGRCDARGSRRRLQALARIGWSGEALAARSGQSPITLASIQRGAVQLVHARLYHSIRDTYEQLALIPGPSKQARVRAENKGWHGPAMWDDPDTDVDPVIPTRLTRPADDYDEAVVLRRCAGDRSTTDPTSAERHEIVARLHAKGMNDRQIADLAGMAHETAQRIRNVLGLGPNLEAGQEVRRSA